MKYIKKYNLFNHNHKILESIDISPEEIYIKESSNLNDYLEIINNNEWGDLFSNTKNRLITYHEWYCLDPDREKEDPAFICYVIYHNDKKIGFIGQYQMLNYIGERTKGVFDGTIDHDRLSKDQKYRKPNEYWMGWFGIIPEYRGTIAAKTSIDRLCESIKSMNKNATRLLLDTEENNDRAKRFYLKNGFKYLSNIGNYCKLENIYKNDHFGASFKNEDVIFYKDLI